MSEVPLYRSTWDDCVSPCSLAAVSGSRGFKVAWCWSPAVSGWANFRFPRFQTGAVSELHGFRVARFENKCHQINIPPIISIAIRYYCLNDQSFKTRLVAAERAGVVVVLTNGRCCLENVTRLSASSDMSENGSPTD